MILRRGWPSTTVRVMRIQCEKVGPEFFEDKQHCSSVHEIVQATPERVFEIFQDAESWTKWALPITDVEWTSPFPLDEGATRTVSMMGDLVGYEEFIVWDPPRRMAFRFNEVNKAMVKAFAEDYRVHDLGDGRSLVEWTMGIIPDGPSVKLHRFTKPSTAAGLAYMLKRFRKYVDSDPVLANDGAAGK